jgi:excisionase family DNA binding protein
MSAAEIVYLDAEEAAVLLRTSRKAVYSLWERGQLPGARKFRKRLLIRRDLLVRAIEESVPSPKPNEVKR